MEDWRGSEQEEQTYDGPGAFDWMDWFFLASLYVFLSITFWHLDFVVFG